MSAMQEENPLDQPGAEAAETDGATAYHLLLDADEAPVLRTALELLIDDATRESGIRGLARGPLAALPEAREGQQWPFSLPLEPGEMKIVHTALHLLLDDLQRDQDDEIQILHRILAKLPDEHAIRAITID
jgi:hypothetical protein